MAGGAADPAVVLRLCMRFGRLDDALALAHAHVAAWLTQARRGAARRAAQGRRGSLVPPGWFFRNRTCTVHDIIPFDMEVKTTENRR